MISVLFAAKDSVYKTIPGLDVWDENRDALKWPGGNPGIFHPPCRLFCMLKHFSTAPQNEKKLAYWSVDMVRKNGGVLEHPARSLLWHDMNLPQPGSLFEDPWGFTIEIDQFRFGHPARKRTWIYICGVSVLPPVPPWPYLNVFGGAEHKLRVIGKTRIRDPDGYKLSRLFDNHKSLRSATPPAFARWLMEVASNAGAGPATAGPHEDSEGWQRARAADERCG